LGFGKDSQKHKYVRLFNNSHSDMSVRTMPFRPDCRCTENVGVPRILDYGWCG